MSEHQLQVSDLLVEQRLRGIIPGQTVELLSVKMLDDDLAELVYRDELGQIGERTVTASELVGVSVVADSEAAPPFDGDPQDFRLAAEALRIKYAALYDPMAAVNSSDVDPLPHQIRAVYEELLPRIPLRFLLADDPGAGKTIMAGLYLKELFLRSDCERAIIVAPGGLVEQWRDELAQKFDLNFTIFHPSMLEETRVGNPFVEHPYLIVRMDQISRSDEWMQYLADVQWDIAVVDEAHRMSARYSMWAGDIDETKRFKLGRLLSETAHNFLLMTATPHAGKEEDFQLFMSLLDRDRFEGQFREGVHRTDTKGLMRRMVKEDLLTFEGKPLFPERRAYTVSYELSPAERDLYDQVSDYVRQEMGRADRLVEQGDGKRGNTVGFALTVLQRRLASSPEAILRSLERRKARLAEQLEQLRMGNAQPVGVGPMNISADMLLEEATEEEQASIERQIEEVMAMSTAAQTIPELEYEINVLSNLIHVAQRVRAQGDDKKWVELRTILDEQLLSNAPAGDNQDEGHDGIRKIIIFTEHRDTLSYLEQKIGAQFGRENAVVTIHGGTPHAERKAVREQFTHNPETVVLLATDAAGEGLNLQRAHLMVNYDLPWNPNRIEQRFGRIHRIGQREVCHLWNLVAEDTREGSVFTRLLEKINNMNRAYNGNLFNVLGDDDAFQGDSLKNLLIEAIRYGNKPGVRSKLDRVIDSSVSNGLDNIIAERALHRDLFNNLELEKVRARMEKARERKLQPGFISAFFIPAFQKLGGQIRKREQGRYEITRIPTMLIDAARRTNPWAPVAPRYERVTFDLHYVRVPGRATASLIAPGHPLLSVVLEMTIKNLGNVLAEGSIFVDRSDKQLDTPALLYTVEQRITTSAPTAGIGNSTGGRGGDTVSHHFDYLILSQKGDITVTTAPLYLNYTSPTDDEMKAIHSIIDNAWVSGNYDKTIRPWAYRHGIQPRMEELRAHRDIDIERTRVQVKERLLAEINHWDSEYSRLLELERSGTIGRLRASDAKKRAEDLEQRLDTRLKALEQARELSAAPTLIRGVALVIPSALIEVDDAGKSATFAKEVKRVERRAVEAVLAAERALGHTPKEMARNNPGYDIHSTDPRGYTYYIEVKGRIHGSETFTVTANEIQFGQTQKEHHKLALVDVHPDGPDHDEIRYITQAFDHIESSVTTQSYNEKWRDYWSRGAPPL